MRFEDVKVGQELTYITDKYLRVCSFKYVSEEDSILGNTYELANCIGLEDRKPFFIPYYAEVELITKCKNCCHCYLEETPPHNDKKQAYKCEQLDVWIEKVKYLGGGQSDIREDPETFSCSIFEERGEG